MNELPYNPKDADSIIYYAKKLVGKTLKRACNLNQKKFLGKGGFGQTLEKYYFLYEVNSNAEADFKFAGLELKSSPLKKLKKKPISYNSKERVVISIIDYMKIVEEEFEKSSLWRENNHILFVFYLYEEGLSFLDYETKLVGDWKFPQEDIIIIKKDWETIQHKILEGKAHELSEGDTLYLGACTKGGKSTKLRQQPNSRVKAKQRAFSLKQGYVNHIIASIAGDKHPEYGRLIESVNEIKKHTLEELILKKFSKYIGMNADDIAEKFNLLKHKKNKSFYAMISKSILGGKSCDIEELLKADIEVKAIRLGEKDSLPKESISFPAFKYTEIVNQDFDDSKIKEILEKKILFVFYKYQGDDLILEKVKLWNMPYEHLLKVREVWDSLKMLIKRGQIIKEYIKGKRRKTYFPTIANEVAHIRPHGTNSEDVYELPIPDKLTGLKEYTKHCFWLYNKYIRKAVYYEGNEKLHKS